jgi:DNA-3-methyladenine glycosylase
MSSMPEPNRLDRRFFARDVVVVARGLIGCTLWTNRSGGFTAGIIVETEAYSGVADPASHAARLKNGRVQSMRGLPGIAYIYRSYGIHTMLNLVCEPEGSAAAVLIRALEPVEGIELMRARRGIDDDARLCRGPGSLTIAMDIRLDDHGVDVVASDWLWLTPAVGDHDPVAGERIGISRGKEHPWRFFVADSPFVSAHRRAMALDSPA